MTVRRSQGTHSGFTLKLATTADLGVLTEQRIAMYRDIHPDLALDYAGYARTYKAWVRKMMRKKKFVSFLALNRIKEPVAGGSLWVRETQPSARYPGTEVPYLISMYTRPDNRGKGLATLIVKEAIRWAKEQGYTRLTLHASKMGEPVYTRLGFEPTTEMRLILAHPRRPAC